MLPLRIFRIAYPARRHQRARTHPETR